jgi:Fe-S cluster assembly ATPase SufC
VLQHDRARATGKGVLDGVDLSIGKGETIALTGPNGSHASVGPLS